MPHTDTDLTTHFEVGTRRSGNKPQKLPVVPWSVPP